MGQTALKMNKIAFSLLLFLVFKIGAEPSIMPFNYYTDLPQLEVLLKKEWPTLFWNPSYDANLVSIMFKSQNPGDLNARKKKLFISVLKENNLLLGFITYYQPDSQTGHIELLAIDPVHQGLGYGKKMVNFVKDWCINLRCKYLQLYVFTNNPNAIQFYHHLGFSVKKTFYGFLLLSKTIN